MNNLTTNSEVRDKNSNTIIVTTAYFWSNQLNWCGGGRMRDLSSNITDCYTSREWHQILDNNHDIQHRGIDWNIMYQLMISINIWYPGIFLKFRQRSYSSSAITLKMITGTRMLYNSVRTRSSAPINVFGRMPWTSMTFVLPGSWYNLCNFVVVAMISEVNSSHA